MIRANFLSNGHSASVVSELSPRVGLASAALPASVLCSPRMEILGLGLYWANLCMECSYDEGRFLGGWTVKVGRQPSWLICVKGNPKVMAAPSRNLGIFVRCDTMGHGFVGLS